MIMEWTPLLPQTASELTALGQTRRRSTAAPPLSASTTEADAALIERARPTLDANWLCFSLQDETAPENEIMLCYQRTAHTMIVAERRIKDAET